MLTWCVFTSRSNTFLRSTSALSKNVALIFSSMAYIFTSRLPRKMSDTRPMIFPSVSWKSSTSRRSLLWPLLEESTVSTTETTRMSVIPQSQPDIQITAMMNVLTALGRFMAIVW